jgi:DNA polymerase III alpha subunit
MIRTGYSFRRAFGHLDDVYKRITEIGLPAYPIADTCTTFGFVKWAKLCKKKGTRPVFGVELAVATDLEAKKPTLDYWTFFAKDDLARLNELIRSATKNNHAALTYEEALAATGVFKIAGHAARLDLMPASGAPPDLFIGLSPAVSKGFYNAAKRAGYSFVARSDNFYPVADQLELYRVALGFRSNTQTYPQHILSDDEWREATRYIAAPEEQDAALVNRNFIIENSRAELKKAVLLVPEKKKTLREMCEEGAAKLGCDIENETYAARLDRELRLIDEKNFGDYFYIIADVINWAKSRMVVGPARGSSCGSLVCYLLGITAIDPIPYGLIFERFIDINRKDLPDIDIDFSDKRRDMVFEYVEDKYGREHVARLGTVGMFKPRSALNQVGASLQIPKWMVERTLEGVIERSSGDSRALQALEDAMTSTPAGRALLEEFPEAKIAAKMEGHPNTSSQHAAGIIITEKSITEFIGVDARTGATMCDKKDAEELNLLKIDALGLTQLSIFERTLQLIGKPDVSGFLETIPLDDPKAFAVLNEGRFSGIFQFTGQALKSLTKQIKVENLEDMISITALARPGPMATGGANAWVRRRRGEEAITTLHPMLTELTKDTFGIVVFQETVMRIAREMGQLSWEDTSELRKAMSKSLGDEFFAGYWEKFRIGAVAQGVPENIAKQIWDQVNTFGSWAFNRSHAVAYGIVSYWTCWLKAHYPLEFAAATLDAEDNPMKQIAMLRELAEEGIDYVPVDIEYSSDRWTFREKDGKKILVGPLMNIKGIGEKMTGEIMDCRRTGKPIRAALMKRLAGAVTPIDTLYPIRDAIARLHPDLTAINIHTKPTRVIDVQCGVSGVVMVLVVAKKIAPLNENELQKVQKRIKIAKDNGRISDGIIRGPTDALNMFIEDDTDEVFCKIDRYMFESIGRPIVDRGKPGKALYAIKGTIPPDFRMISVTQVRYLGDIDEPIKEEHSRRGYAIEGVDGIAQIPGGRMPEEAEQ